MKLSEYLKIGTKMKILRKEKGISQKEMAEILEMIPSAYSNYENHFTDIPVEIMKKFCDTVGCSMSELIGFDVSISEDVHPISLLSDLMLAIMELNKKKLPVSVTFHSDGEKMNVDFQVAQTEYDEILDELEGELGKYQEKKIDKNQFRQNVRSLLDGETNYKNNYLNNEKNTDGNWGYKFMGLSIISNMGLSVDGKDYRMMFMEQLHEHDSLDELYHRFNAERPEGFDGHSLSVSDVVIMKRNGEMKAYYVDDVGFSELPEFTKQREQIIDRSNDSPVYAGTLEQAVRQKDADAYLDSRKLNIDSVIFPCFIKFCHPPREDVS